MQVGQLRVRVADLDHELRERGASAQSEVIRRQELQKLGQRAQLAAAALDAGLLEDSAIRVELARLLASRYQELNWTPQLRAIQGPLPAAELRALYESNVERYQSPEKRRVAVLWLNPGADERRRAAYAKRLSEALAWYQGQGELQKNPNEGFSVLSVDHSEHQASRFKGGMLGWLSKQGNSEAWQRAVAEIAFSLPQVGAVSGVVSRPEGVFLVRLVGLEPAVQKPFEQVAPELERQALEQRRRELQKKLSDELSRRYPIQPMEGGQQGKP
jgi:peptidyl-prolyl cis-trans isomerase D